jgi:hypothetical protein
VTACVTVSDMPALADFVARALEQPDSDAQLARDVSAWPSQFHEVHFTLDGPNLP